MSEAATLLVCTVGGSPEPVVASIVHWRPLRILFVHTAKTKGDVAASILPRANEHELRLDAGRYELLELRDEQDLALCLDQLRKVTSEIHRWVARGDRFQVVVDFTGGTKCMTAAVALQAQHWPCRFSYVGGDARNKNGVGIVVSGAEKIVHQENPWDTLGYQAVEEFAALFDQCSFAAAARTVEDARSRCAREDRKRELSVLASLAKGMDAWDPFAHKDAANRFKEADKAANDLRAVLGGDRANRVLEGVSTLAGHLDALGNTVPPSRHHVIDLLANARRRRQEGRFDDAVARLYRAIEAMAQKALKESHDIDLAAGVPLHRLPDAQRDVWASKARDGIVRLGLQDAYELLAGLGHPLAARFQAAGLAGGKSPLHARNGSILAHGFDLITDKTCDALWRAAIALAEIDEAVLPAFVTLGGLPGAAGRP